MKNTFFRLAIILLTSANLCAQKTIKIGEQTWCAENLNVSTFRNGDPIIEVKTEKEWKKALKENKPAYCYYNNDSINNKKYGKLYNAYAVLDPRGLAPVGFHIPNNEEWTKLGKDLGGWKKAGDKLKSSSDWDGDNSAGFNAQAGGIRYANGPNGFGGSYNMMGNMAYFWNSNTKDAFFFKSKKSYLGKTQASAGCFLSIRCIGG